MIAIAWLLLGLIALIVGAELIVRGGARMAARLGISPIVIGLTIVSVGTSTPELAVGIEAAQRGAGSLAVGNIAGTNIVNILLILGLSAWIRPLALGVQTLRYDLPIISAVAFALLIMAWNGELTRLEGGLLVSAAIAYTLFIIWLARRESSSTKAEFAREYSSAQRTRPMLDLVLNLAALIGGIVIIVLGSDWLVDGAVVLAKSMGVSDALMGLTVIAIGTSSPELVTTVIGTIRNDRDIAIGNLLGSSIYNILFILGVTCLVPSQPVQVDNELRMIDIPVMTAVALICIPAFLTQRTVSRIEGALFVGAYCVYLAYLMLMRV